MSRKNEGYEHAVFQVKPSVTSLPSCPNCGKGRVKGYRNSPMVRCAAAAVPGRNVARAYYVEGSMGILWILDCAVDFASNPMEDLYQIMPPYARG